MKVLIPTVITQLEVKKKKRFSVYVQFITQLEEKKKITNLITRKLIRKQSRYLKKNKKKENE
jgi:hypothetical protein